MKRHCFKTSAWPLLLVLAVVLAASATGQGAVVGETGTIFNLTARADYISTSDGDSFLMWLYGVDVAGRKVQYPGPTLIVTQGQPITVNLRNELPPQAGNVSIVFPGQVVAASGGVPGLLTREAPPDGLTTVTYTFVADQPGTYLYRSGTRSDLQVEMGLAGALIVRPLGFDPGNPKAYTHANTSYDDEFLYLLTEMDPNIHRQVEFGQYSQVDTSVYFATNWFINGRNFPDNMAGNNVPWLPTQPYNNQPIIEIGKKALIRCIGAGRELHPMHYHGNDFEVIAMDGRVLSSGTGEAGDPDLAWMATTIKFVPGQTADLIWKWTGEELGFDAFGHDPADPLAQGEYAPDHGKPFPVIIPTRDSLTFGDFYSGSPFLGTTGDLPPGHAGLNDLGGYFFMWHSHTEKELTSNDIWPGGLVSFGIVVPQAVP